MSLLDRCQSLQDKRKLLTTLHGNAQETTTLQLHAKLLTTVFQEFSGAVKLRLALLDERITLQRLDQQKVQEVAVTLDRIRERFKENPGRQALVVGKDWPTLTDGLKLLIASIRNSCYQGWNDFTSEFFDKTGISEDLVKTDSNIVRLHEYKKLFQDLQLLVNDCENIQSVRTFKLKGKRLLELTTELNNFQAPNDVKQFINAVHSNGGAPLDLLTAEVLEWLKEQNMYSKYKIVGG